MWLQNNTISYQSWVLSKQLGLNRIESDYLWGTADKADVCLGNLSTRCTWSTAIGLAKALCEGGPRNARLSGRQTPRVLEVIYVFF